METAGNGTVVMVTGAAGNLGHAVVHGLVANGYRLVCVERSSEALERLADYDHVSDMVRLGGIDLTDTDSCKEAVGRALKEFGRVDALVNTVGGFEAGPVAEAGVNQWERLFRTNAQTAYTISAAVLRPMQKAGYGRIVHIAAAPGLKASANQAAYAASKGAVIRLTEAIAAENRDKRISANCILPGTIDTPQNRAAMPNAKTDSWVQPGDIAKLIGFLVSPAGGVVTGAAIPATGRI
ncbi:SDR family NAD(P)-dependent oxidoreductase [Rhizobium leguminosarum]|uniref:SDR family NAD(P)-dependent oxidoreductase n=1 Tax=Rhizobium leguminosarum TaxID=384 RepID=UPI001441DB91|nr:SDR family NAD(P)-dependent oxidoreductase [Rhizobium leguminosarum]NKN02330.1 SDR family NAD(P)-dependent oxidoreductase [Rhizobium leguminosarum bv. viciae]